MKRVVHIIQIITNIGSGHLSAWLLFALMCLVLIEVVTRYVLRSPLIIADELGAYAVVAIAFMGLAFTWKERGHVRIEFVISKLPTKARNWLRLITLILATAFVLVLIYAGYNVVAYSVGHGVRSDSWLRTLLQWPQVVLVIGVVLLLFQLIVEIVKAKAALGAPEEQA